MSTADSQPKQQQCVRQPHGPVDRRPYRPLGSSQAQGAAEGRQSGHHGFDQEESDTCPRVGQQEAIDCTAAPWAPVKEPHPVQLQGTPRTPVPPQSRQAQHTPEGSASSAKASELQAPAGKEGGGRQSFKGECISIYDSRQDSKERDCLRCRFQRRCTRGL